MYQVLTPNSPPIGQRLTNKARSIVLAALLLCTALGVKAQGITVSVNGGEQLTKNTLQEAVTTSGVTPTDVIRLEVVDGDLAQSDAQYMVDELTNLEMLTLTSAKQFNVELQHHPSLRELNAPLLESIADNAFNGCRALTSVSLPVATNIGAEAFYNCDALTSVSLSAATSIGEGAFSNCQALTSVSLPVATSIGKNTFFNCRVLTSVSLPVATSIGENTFFNCDALTSVSLPNAISIGNWAFEDCDALTSVSLPNTTNISNYAFANCNALTNVSLPAATTIGGSAFVYCDALSSVSLPAVTIVGAGAFAYCDALTSVSLPNATNIGEDAFSNCYALTNISLPAATSIGSWAFQGCNLLTFLELGATPPTLGNKAFYGCPRPRYLQMPMANADAYKNDNDGDTNDNLWHGWLINEQPTSLTVKVNGGAEHTASSLHEAIAANGVILSKVTQLEVLSGDLLASDAAYMVNMLTKLEKFTLTSAVEFNLQIQGHPSLKELNAPMLESIGNNAFSDCDSLASVNLPAATSIGERAFNNCNALTNVSLPNTTNIGNYAFANCNALTSVNLPAANSIGSWTFQGCNLLTFLELGATPPTLGNSAFAGCPNLRFLQVNDADAYKNDNDGDTNDNLWHGWLINEQPAPLTVKVNGGAESSASSLHEAITDSGVDPANVAQLEVLSGDLLASDAAYMVNTLTKLEKLTLTSAKQFNIELQYHPSLRELYAPMLESIGNNAFYGCDSLASVSLPAATSIGERAFSYCGALTSVNLPVATSIGEWTFSNCYNLTSVSLPAATSIGRWAFSDCYSLASVNLPAATIIGESAFNNCNALSNVSLPAATSIGGSAFNNCNALSSVSLPAATSIGGSAFAYCNALTNVSIPNATNIGSWTFENCSAFTFLELGTTPPTLGNSAFAGCPNLRFLQVNDADAYKNDNDDDTNDNLWHGWLINVQPAPLTVKVNGGAEHTGSSLYDAIADSGVDPANVTWLEVLSGDLLASDAAYMVNMLTKLEKLTLTSAVEFNLQIRSHPSLQELYAPMLESISDYAFYGCDSLTSVSLPAATSIGNWAFYDCNALTSVNLPAATSIGNWAFENCYSLASVSLPAATSIGGSAFAYCNALTNVRLPNATNIGSWTFENCSAFTFLELGTTPPTLGYSSFNGCPSQRYLQVNDADAYKNDNDGDTNDNLWHGWLINVQPAPLTVKVNGGAEHTGSSLYDAIADSGIDPANVTQLEVLSGDLLASDAAYMVNTLTKLEKFTLTSAVEFNLQIQRHPSLKELHAPMLESISDYAFYGCDSLTSVSLPAATNIGERAFAYCNSLTNVSLPAATSIGEIAFSNCHNLTSVSLPAATIVGEGAFAYCNALTNVSIPNATNIGSWTFENCSAFTFLVLGTTPPTLGYSSFNGCPSQRYLQVNDADAYKNDNDGDTNDNLWHGWLINEQPTSLTVKVNGGAEHTGSSLHDAIADSGVDPANVAQLEVLSGDLLASDAAYMVNMLTKLEKLTLTSAVEFNLQIQRHPSLKELYAPMLESIGNNAFYVCDSLISVSMPVATSIGERAFSNCHNLTSVSLPAATIVGEGAFAYCDALTSVSLSAATSIGNGAFENCHNLTNVNLPAATIVGEGAFAYCDALTSVSLPAATSIGENAFNYCKQLIFFNLRATPPTLKNKYVFDGCPSPRYLMLVDAEGNLLTGNELTTAQNAYRANAGWSTIMQTWHGWTLSEGFLIRALPAEGGTVIGAGNYAKGSDVSLTAIPNTGYSFVMWSESGSQVSSADTYTFECTANRTLTAVFEAHTYTLSYTAGEGGSISGQATQTVKHGQSGTEVEAVPNVGYRFVKWSDGVATAKRTDSNVQANLSATAEFEKSSTTGLFDTKLDALSVYPNPTAGQLWISVPELAEGIAAEVHVYNANGQLLQRVPARAASTGSAASRVSIDLSSYPSGMYIIRVGNAIAKVVKH